MPSATPKNQIASESPTRTSAPKAPTKPFPGFAPPTSNTTYTPNQFFDVCIPHCSRGAVRLVAYMLRKTLGWCDADGNPREEQVLVSYQDLVMNAGISRQMIRQALDESLAGHFIRCIRPGRSKTSGDAGETALYELCWDGRPEYIKDPKRFKGFFEGEGNRTDIPNEFFDRVIPNESLAVIKVVGSVIRFSIGFEARRGRRRQRVQLSYRHIQRYTRMRSRTTLGTALRAALRRGYIVRLEEGVFDPQAGRLSRAATYGLKWADAFSAPPANQKTAAMLAGERVYDRSEKRAGDRSENRTGIGQKNGPEDRSEKWTGIEMKQGNETSKQQAMPVRADAREAFKLLEQQGFGPKIAWELAGRHPKQRIEEQIAWLALRRPQRNPLGMLRLSIEENWTSPVESGPIPESPGAVFAAHFYAGYAGNTDQPVGEPSVRDATLAGRYAIRLQEAAAGECQAGQWGRDFGRMSREELPPQGKAHVSLTWALRVLGDAFYLRFKSRLNAERAAALRVEREAHEQLYREAWLSYLQTEEERLKEEKPDEYARFEARRDREHRRLAASPWKAGREKALAHHDKPERQLLDFQSYFSDEVLGFWPWDARFNPHLYNQNQIKP